MYEISILKEPKKFAECVKEVSTLSQAIFTQALSKALF